ncbi:hypothetical protein V8F20_003247 [Naviculisporaceae sp. PSN 640]
MAEVLGLVASVIQVAAAGLQLSKTISDYGSAVQGSEKRLKGLDKDIYFTSGIISELATLLKDQRVQSLVSQRSIELTREIVAEFEGMFEAIEDVIEAIRGDSLGKWKIYFRESKIKLLLSNLDRLKGNLQLLIGVITHTCQITAESPDEATMVAHRIKILELMVEKEEYTQRYLEEKRKYDNLMVQVNSTSTLGSVSTIHTENGTTGTWRGLVMNKGLHSSRAPRYNESLENQGKGKAVAVEPVSEPADTMLTAIYEDISPESEALNDELERDNGIQGLKAEIELLKASISPKAEHRSPSNLNILNSPMSANLGPGTNVMGTQRTITKQAPLLSSSGREEPSDIGLNSGPQTTERSTPGSFPKRDFATSKGKKVAKGAAYVLAGTAAVALFPITIPLWYFYSEKSPRYKEKKRVMMTKRKAFFIRRTAFREPDPNSAPVDPHVSPFPIAPAPQPAPSYHEQLSYYPQPSYYQSGTIPAELPGPHELIHERAANVAEMALVEELTTYRVPARSGEKYIASRTRFGDENSGASLPCVIDPVHLA